MRLQTSLRLFAYIQGLIVGVFILGALGCTAISAPNFGAGPGGSSGAAGSGGAGPGIDAGQREAGGDGPGSLGDGRIATDGMKDAPGVGDGPSSGGGNGGGGSIGGAGGSGGGADGSPGGAGGSPGGAGGSPGGAGGNGGGGAGGMVPDAAVDYPALIPDALLASGATCSANGACASGICADAVCCDRVCTGCNACTRTLTGQPDGTCGFVTSGLNAHSTCKDETTTKKCGNDGTCDGAGACRNASTSVVCADASCSGSIFSPVSTCDGKGACVKVTTQDCAPYLCASTGCQKTCAVPADCDTTKYYCDTTKKTCAAKLSNGTPASSGAQCTSGFVADGVCCDRADCSGCMACTLALNGQTDGQCLAVPVNKVGHNTCTAANPPCGTTGMCDGAGHCQNGASATSCGSTCTGSTLTTKTCDGAGACVARTPTSCSPYVCAATGDVCGTKKGNQFIDGCSAIPAAQGIDGAQVNHDLGSLKPCAYRSHRACPT